MQNRLLAWFDVDELVEVEPGYHPDVAEAIDSGEIDSSDALYLAKMPWEKQLFWAEKAKEAVEIKKAIREEGNAHD